MQLVIQKSVICVGLLLYLVNPIICLPNRAPPKLSKHPKLVVFSYDGFRFDYMTKTTTPNLDTLKKNGVTTPYVIPQFASFTFPNHQSLSTGLNTENHGIMANRVWDPFYNKVLSGYRDHDDFWKFSENIYPLWVINKNK